MGHAIAMPDVAPLAMVGHICEAQAPGWQACTPNAAIIGSNSANTIPKMIHCRRNITILHPQTPSIPCRATPFDVDS
jgi:hypothetical protein